MLSFLISSIFLSFLSLSLTGCQSIGDLTSQKPLNYDIEGNWVDAHGMISTFHSGMMTTYAPDTHEKLSEGNYLTSKENVHIQVRSLVRGAFSDIECKNDVKNAQLLCQSKETGVSFALKRAE